MTAHHSVIKHLLPAALCVLLSLALLPGSYNSVSTKGVFFCDPSPSLLGIQTDDLSASDGEDHKFNRPTVGALIVPATAYISQLPASALGTAIAFAINQARAPPSL